MQNQTDYIINEELARRYQSGDKSALKELIKRFNSALEAKVYAHTRDKESLNDIIQDCWFAIIDNLDEVKFQIGFEAWALNIARNKAVDWIRSRQQQRRKLVEILNEEMVTADDSTDIREAQIKKLRVNMNLLPESQKIILELFYKDNLSLSEVSKLLGVPEGTVKSRLFTAREQLKKLIH